MPKSAAEIRRENFAAEVKGAGGVQQFVDKYDENIDYVRQILRGKSDIGSGRNIGNRAARRIETLLGRPLNWLDQDHSDVRPTALITNQTENDIDALRYAVGAIMAAMGAMRPAEGAAVATAIRAQAPTKFVENGLLKELLSALDKGVKKAKTRQPAPSA